MNLNTARIFVRDISSARTFYTSGLGLSIKADGSADGYCVFDAGASSLVVEEVPVDASEEERARLVGRFTGLSFDVPNAAKAFELLCSRGVTFTGEPQKQSWGGTLATLRDPSGNELQICEYPAREPTLDERIGSVRP